MGLILVMQNFGGCCSLSQLSDHSGNQPLYDIMRVSDERSLFICKLDALYHRVMLLPKSDTVRFGTGVINTTYLKLAVYLHKI
jgi:hypothetical protein